MKDLKINCPEGYEIDMYKSNLSEGIVYFKEVEKVLKYQDISNLLFLDKKSYYIDGEGEVEDYEITHNDYESYNHSTTKDQLESILALNKLCNVAKYLNGDWLPNWEDGEYKYIFSLIKGNNIKIDNWLSTTFTGVYFKTKELAKQAIKILGEEEIKKALTLNH